MKTISKTLLAGLTVLALSACGSSGNQQPSTQSSSRADNTPTHSVPVKSSSNACKLLADHGGKGKNMVFRCHINTVLKDSIAKGDLESMPISFGGNGKYRTNATARSFGNDEAASCERAVTNALKSLQNRVNKEGGRRVTEAVSYRAGSNGRFDAKSYAPAGYADCIVATFQSRAVMRGSVGR